MIPKTTKETSYPYSRGLSPHQVYLELKQEKKIFNEKVELLETMEIYADWGSKALEPIHKKQDKIRELASKVISASNPVQKVESQFNLLNEYRSVNAEMSKLLDNNS